MYNEQKLKEIYIDDIMQEHEISRETAEIVYKAYFSDIVDICGNAYWDTWSKGIANTNIKEITCL